MATSEKTSGKRVLVVDDEATLREIIQQEFTRRGWETLSAGGGFEALEMLQTDPTDLVVTDVRMANGSGLQLLDSIQTGDLTRKPVVVLISGYSEVDEFKALKRGAAGFFLKPFQLREFVDNVLKLYEDAGKKAA